MPDKTEPVSGDEEKFTKEQAIQEVNMIFQQICLSGAVDFEPSAIKEILGLLEKDSIEPNEAVKRVRKIQFTRQEYH